MSVMLNSKGLTEKQIALAEPHRAKIAQYDRKIAHENSGIDIMAEPYEQAKQRRDRIAAFNKKRSKEVEMLNDILNKRSEYDARLSAAIAEADELTRIKEFYGF